MLKIFRLSPLAQTARPRRVVRVSLLTIHLNLTVALVCLNSCSTEPSGSSAGTVGNTITFGLPSVESIYEEYFANGKKSRNSSYAFQASVSDWGSKPIDKVSIIRKWKIYYDEMDDRYSLSVDVNSVGGGSYHIFLADHVKPTPEALRRIFGRYIIFPGDDMSRVRIIHLGGAFPREELVLNDGRTPADTFRPDDWRQ